MCLFPIDGYQQMLIPPTERARKLAVYMRGVIYFHLLVILGFFLSALYVDGVVDLLGALIGFMSIRNSRGYNFQQVLCYSIYLGMDCFWSVIRSVLFLSGLSRNQTPLARWQYNVYVVTIIGSGVFYAVGCVIAWQLYRELRSIFTRMMEEAPPLQIQNGGVAAAPGAGSAAGQYQAVPSDPNAAGGIPAPSAQDDDFTPFTGKKYSLR
mmetsp:Transcript_8748/g.17159  ORF Transcript_8748/g.17159 Transcript_8748/m.17159 type:complete len:209 (-) Transcript_8748:412-1038(-)